MMTIGQLLDMFVVTHLLPNSLTDGALSLTHLLTHPPTHSLTHHLILSRWVVYNSMLIPECVVQAVVQ